MKKHNIKRIINFLRDIDWLFELNNFEKTIVEMENQPSEYPDLTAEIGPDMIYKEITVKLYPHFWELSLDLQRKALIHELTHTLLQNIKIFAIEILDGTLHTKAEIKKENEKATTSITHIFDCLLRGRLTYARIAYKKYIEK